MAHFAKISEDNKVLQVLTLNNSDTINADGQENEAVGQAYLEKHNNAMIDDIVKMKTIPFIMPTLRYNFNKFSLDFTIAPKYKDINPTTTSILQMTYKIY